MYKLRDYSLRRAQRLHPHLRQQVRPGHYAVNLPLLMATCSANYLRLSQLTQTLSGETLQCLIDVGQHQLGVVFSLIDQARYTTTWSMHVSSTASASLMKWPNAQIRAYHDAQLVEVLSWEGQKHFLPRYDTINEQGYERDEKHQLNRLLSEWMSLCLESGRVSNYPLTCSS